MTRTSQSGQRYNYLKNPLNSEFPWECIPALLISVCSVPLLDKFIPFLCPAYWRIIKILFFVYSFSITGQSLVNELTKLQMKTIKVFVIINKALLIFYDTFGESKSIRIWNSVSRMYSSRVSLSFDTCCDITSKISNKMHN